MNSQEPFRLQITDIFTIKGHGIIVTGVVQSGSLKIKDTIRITGGSQPDVVTHVAGIPMSDIPIAYDATLEVRRVDLFIKGVDPNHIEIGMIVTTEGI